MKYMRAVKKYCQKSRLLNSTKNEFLGETKTIHHMEIHPSAGKHTLTLVDGNGESLVKEIEVIEK